MFISPSNSTFLVCGRKNIVAAVAQQKGPGSTLFSGSLAQNLLVALSRAHCLSCWELSSTTCKQELLQKLDTSVLTKVPPKLHHSCWSCCVNKRYHPTCHHMRCFLLQYTQLLENLGGLHRGSPASLNEACWALSNTGKWQK